MWGSDRGDYVLESEACWVRSRVELWWGGEVGAGDWDGGLVEVVEFEVELRLSWIFVDALLPLPLPLEESVSRLHVPKSCKG